MRYVLLTWNPGPKDEEQYTPEQWRDEMVVPLRDGRPPDGDRWSIGTNWKIIQAGDMACMFRQGVHGRGIVATGLITRGAFRASHWNPYKTGDTWYVNVAWNRAFDLNQMITIDELAREVPGFAWNRVYSSGRIVDGSPAEHLASLLGQGPLLPGAQQKVGQQYGTAEHNQLVELTAMEIVTASYEAEHYIVRDVSKQRLGWDLEARRGGTVSHIEVKGTTGPLPEFFLTPNEHRAASDQTGWVAVVVTKIFGAEPACHEFSGPQVTAAAKPTQYLVKAGP